MKIHVIAAVLSVVSCAASAQDASNLTLFTNVNVFDGTSER